MRSEHNGRTAKFADPALEPIRYTSSHLSIPNPPNPAFFHIMYASQPHQMTCLIADVGLRGWSFGPSNGEAVTKGSEVTNDWLRL